MSSSEAGDGVSKPKVLPSTTSSGIKVYNRRFRNQVRKKTVLKKFVKLISRKNI